MKSNVALQLSLNLSLASQKIWYAAKVLKAACVSSPAALVRAAVPAVAAKAAIIAQTAKPARPASALVPGTSNTTGFTFGQIYLNSPAYPAGAAIPAIPAKPASAAVVGVPAVLPVAAIVAVSSPAVVALPGQENAVTITPNLAANSITITVKFPRNAGVGIVGGAKTIKEFTPSTLQATAWVGDRATGTAPILAGDLATETLEAYLYRNMKLLPQTTEVKAEDSITVSTVLYLASGYSGTSDSLQFDKIKNSASAGTGGGNSNPT